MNGVVREGKVHPPRVRSHR